MLNIEEEQRYQKAQNELAFCKSEWIRKRRQEKINYENNKNRKLPLTTVGQVFNKTLLNQSRCYVDNDTITDEMKNREIELWFNNYKK